MLVSIIVPIYNTENFLSMCLNSIINQTYKNIEIILIDDGSTDASLKICNHFAQADSRITIISGNHQGLTASRVLGVKKSKGEYCIFVDSDDWISENLLESVLKLSQNGAIDIVNYSMTSINENKAQKWNYTIPEGLYEDKQLDFIYSKMMFDFENSCPGIIQSLCTKLIKRSLLEKSIYGIDTRITMGEDAAVVCKAMLNAKRTFIINKSFYYYRIHKQSMCHSKDINIFLKIYYFKQYMEKLFLRYNSNYCLNKQLYSYLTFFIIKGVEDLFSLKIQYSYYMPFNLLEDRCLKLVLYGAGNVGKSYYKQLIQNKSISIVAWIDKGLEGNYIFDYKISSSESLKNLEFDKVLIAIKDLETAKKIKKDLRIYIAEDQILWEDPKINFWQRDLEL